MKRVQGVVNVLKLEIRQALRALCVVATLLPGLSALAQTQSATNLSTTTNPSGYSQSITLTASVTGDAPTGTVTFMDGAYTLGSSAMAAGFATFSSSALAAGTHNLTAVYSGDSNNAGSTSSVLTQTVNKIAPTIALTSSMNPANYGQPITISATFSGGNPSGTVALINYSNQIATTELVNGVANFNVGFSAGSHYLWVYYFGDSNHAAGSSALLTQAVNKLSTSTALTTNLNPSSVGQSITLIATVTGGSSPQGMVTFMNGATTLGSSTTSGGVASLNTTALAGGSHNLTAVYSGDSNNLESTSEVLSQGVNVVASGTTLTATPNPASEGQTISLTARLTGFNPTGSVTFLDGGTALGSASVKSSVVTFGDPAATLTLNGLGQGDHNLTAVYSGDVNNAASSSNAVSVSINARAGMTWQYGYDAMGRVNTVVDPIAQASYVYYDSLGRPIQTQQPPNTGSSSPTVTGYSYNLADSLTQVADPRNLATTYTPNGLGNVTSQSSPDTGSTQYTYDAKGNVLTSTDSRSKTTTYVYDKLDRVTSISYPMGTATTFEYDGGSSPTPAEKGELTKMTDESGQTTYAHDAWGRLSTKTTVISGKSFTTSYSWGDTGSAMDKLTGITYPSGSRVNYGYDAQGYISGVSVNPVNANGVGVSGSAVTLLNALSYNAENKITGWLWVNGKARTIAYDAYGQIAAYNLGDALGTGSAAGSLRTVTRDAAGRITGYSHVNNGTAQTSLDQGFGYDNLNRLLSASVGGNSTQYSYDETGNRTSKTIAGNTYTNTVVSTSNRLTQTQDVPGTATIQYDAAGHITNDGTNSFTYSDRGRMSSATNAGGTVSYLYNGLNQRVYKSGPTAMVNTGAAYYLYDEGGQLLGEYDSNGAPVYETIYLGSMPVGVLKQAGSAANSDIATMLYNVHADHIATARVITQQDQAIVWRWDTAEAFGGTAPDQNPGSLGTFTYNQRFPGQVFDSETGLFQNWNREYNARQGRYIQSDPIGLKGGINTFAYVESDPLHNVDPWGLASPKGLRDPRENALLDGGGGGGGFGGPTRSGLSPLGQKPSVSGPQCPPGVRNTLDRIKAGEGYPHRNDGAVFGNREGLLPVKPEGYYREWVHPTPGVNGPGAQRVVTGQGGEVYYTPDHYRTFIPVP